MISSRELKQSLSKDILLSFLPLRVTSGPAYTVLMSHIQRGSSAETRKGIFLKLAKRDSKLSDSKALVQGTSRSKRLFADYPLAQTCSHS